MTTPDSTTETTTETKTETAAPEADSTTETTQTTTETTETSDEATRKAEMDALPEWARKLLTKANGEAANYRTRLREAEESLSKAKTPEEFTAAVAEVQQKNAELEKSLLVTKIAVKHNLPAPLAERLKGDTEADLEKDAQALLALIKVEPSRLGGGLNPNGTETVSSDPRTLRNAGRRRR